MEQDGTIVGNLDGWSAEDVVYVQQLQEAIQTRKLQDNNLLDLSARESLISVAEEKR